MTNLNILTFTGFYLPGYKAGGPIRTIANMVDRLGGEFEFKIITADRDLYDIEPYPDIINGGWDKVGKASVRYLSPNNRSWRHFMRLLNSTGYDILYLNSFFSPHFTIKPLLLRFLRLIPDRPLVIAPRGEFSPGALGLKSLKKKVYIASAKLLGLYKNVVWQASSEHEEAAIRHWFGDDIRVNIAPNLPPLHNVPSVPKLVNSKIKGNLKIIFLSRISRKKNLDKALDMLRGLNGDIQFNIYGPIEDKSYWGRCQKAITGLSKNIKVNYCGSIVHEQVGGEMKKHDLFFFPTLGENFGHVILEALCAGCPVLISDQTPWRNLTEKNIGWDLPLNKPELFSNVLQQCVDMGAEEYAKWTENAQEYGLGMASDERVVEQNRQLFEECINVFG